MNTLDKSLDMYLYELKMYLHCQKLADDYRAKGNMEGYELYMDSARKHYYQSLTYLIH